jgi:hypothetical protein
MVSIEPVLSRREKDLISICSIGVLQTRQLPMGTSREHQRKDGNKNQALPKARVGATFVRSSFHSCISLPSMLVATALFAVLFLTLCHPCPAEYSKSFLTLLPLGSLKHRMAIYVDEVQASALVLLSELAYKIILSYQIPTSRNLFTLRTNPLHNANNLDIYLPYMVTLL